MSPVLYWSAMASISGLVLLEGVDSGLKYSGCLGDVTLSREMWAKSCRHNWELEDARCLLHSSQSGLGHPGSIFYLSGVIFFPLHFSWTSVILCFLRGSTLCNVVHRQHYVILLWKLAFWMLCGFWIVITEVICFYENSLIEILCQFWHFLIVLCVSELSL